MAVQTRPYFITFNGQDRMVEAPNPASAVRHVVGAAVTELRPARGAEVAAWVRAEKKIEIAGQKAQAESPTYAPGDTVTHEDSGERFVAVADDTAGVAEAPDAMYIVQWGADDARDWILANSQDGSLAGAAFVRIRGEQRMTLEHFDTLRQACPEFAKAMVATISGDDGTDTVFAAGLDELRSYLEDNPIALNVVIGAIAARVDPLEGVPLEAPAGE